MIFLVLFFLWYLPQWRFFFSELLFYVTGTPPWFCLACVGLHQLWALPWLLLAAYLWQAFKLLVCLICLRALRFWADVFYSQKFFTSHSFPIFWRIWDSDVIRTLHLGFSSMSALMELPNGASTCSWSTDVLVTRSLFYWLQWQATKHRLKADLLNT